MKIYGVDFTSSPSKRKPIVVASCEIDSGLTLKEFLSLYTLQEFSEFLETEGPWIGGFDFPFSQPEKFIRNIGFPTDWDGMMAAFAKLSKTELETLLYDYRSTRPTGDKHHLRHTDKVSKSISPMMIHGVPVAKMFLTGAVALWKSQVSVLPMRSCEDNRIALEIYPALVARKHIGRTPYKNDSVSKDTPERIAARQKLVSKIPVNMPANLKQKIIDDFRGDLIDALAAAVHAAWAWTMREDHFGIPEDVNRLEGWIINPDHPN